MSLADDDQVHRRRRSSFVLPTTDHPVTNVVHAPPKWWRGRRFLNIILLSVGFMLVSASYNTTSAISNSVISDMHNAGYDFRDGDGYVSLAILYAVQLVITPTIPVVIKYTGGKGALILGGFTQILYPAMFELNSRIFLFIASGVIGFGMSLFWSGNGVVFTLNSSATTANKYAGVFWIIFNCSQIIGNIVVAVKFSHLEVIDDVTRRITFGILMVISLSGLIVFLFLKPPPPNHNDVGSHREEKRPVDRAITRYGTVIAQESADKNCSSPAYANVTDQIVPCIVASTENRSFIRRLWHQWRPTLRLITSPPMLLSIGYFAFTGLNLTLYTSPIPTAVGFNKHFGDSRKQLMGVSGFCTGGAEIIGSLIIILSSNHVSRTISWCTGVVLCAIAVGLSTLNMPLDSTLVDSSAPTILFGSGPSSITICVVAAILFGLSDACTSIVMVALMSDVFGHEHDVVEPGSESRQEIENLPQANDKQLSREQAEQGASATAFAMLNGSQSLVSTIIFFASNSLWLSSYFFMTIPLCIWSAFGFYFVDRNFRAGRYQNYFRNLQ